MKPLPSPFTAKVVMLYCRLAGRLEWYALWLVAADRNGLVSTEKIRAAIDGSLWDTLAEEAAIRRGRKYAKAGSTIAAQDWATDKYYEGTYNGCMIIVVGLPLGLYMPSTTP